MLARRGTNLFALWSRGGKPMLSDVTRPPGAENLTQLGRVDWRSQWTIFSEEERVGKTYVN